MLQQAKKKAGEAPNVQFQVADAHQLPFADQSFDTVVDTFGLCTFEKPGDVLAEMQRVCKEDGQILLLEHGKSTWDWLTRYLDDRAPAHAHRWGCWWNRDINRMVQEAGLTVVRESRHHLGTNYVIIAKPNKGATKRTPRTA
jgi:methyltransferase OMS1, mitochondrial